MNLKYMKKSRYFDTFIPLSPPQLSISLEARETNTTGIVDGPSGVEMGQPGIEYNTVPVQGQQVYPTPRSLGVEIGKPTIDFYDVEPSDPPPSYDELFPAMEQSSK